MGTFRRAKLLLSGSIEYIMLAMETSQGHSRGINVLKIHVPDSLTNDLAPIGPFPRTAIYALVNKLPSLDCLHHGQSTP